LARLAASLRVSSTISRIAGLSPITWPSPSSSWSCRSARTSRRSRVVSSAVRTLSTISSVSKGLFTYVKAPRRIASTAFWIVLYAVMRMTGTSGASALSVSSSSNPSPSGSLWSRIAQSIRCRSHSRRASCTSPASWTTYPSSARLSRSVKRMSFSSSTTSTCSRLTGAPPPAAAGRP